MYIGVPEPHLSTLYTVSHDEIDDTVLTGIIVYNKVISMLISMLIVLRISECLL